MSEEISPFTHWNYRVLKGDCPGDPAFSLVEVYYQEDGKMLWTEVSSPVGITLEELQADLDHMKAATLKPILILVNSKLQEIE